MGNPFFRFKQFEIRQDRCAMKVSTDACLFGAWLAARHLPAGRVLDIGCGTGLLMAMLAQDSAHRLTGIEIDPDAALQASENMASTPWPERLQVLQGDARTHDFQDQFDFIISNPPFYENQLRSDDAKANLARHSSSLNLDDLVLTVKKNLAPKGYLAILLPFSRAEDWIVLAGMHQLRLVQQLDLRQTNAHECFRSMMLFQETFGGQTTRDVLVIRDGNGNYTQKTVQLLRPYYLYL
jgi:tRNA1Val (adenine37-N6)-methyltransferase